jgi:hypothetical protein
MHAGFCCWHQQVHHLFLVIKDRQSTDKFWHPKVMMEERLDMDVMQTSTGTMAALDACIGKDLLGICTGH